jgi:predicted DNA-binding transcriptional regulator YafY
MGKKRITPSKAARTVSLERAARLYRLLQFLATGPKTRAAILQRLRIDIRTFYRDLELLRNCEVAVQLENRRYVLGQSPAGALATLPFPDPALTLGEAMTLAKGRSQVHKKLKRLIDEITG